MKKVLALMLALVLVLSLAACGGGSSSNGNSSEGKKDDASSEVETTVSKLDASNAITEIPKHIHNDAHDNLAKVMQNTYIMKCKVDSISGDYCTCDGFHIYLSVDELVNLNKGDEIAIIGKLSSANEFREAEIYKGTISEIAPREDDIYSGKIIKIDYDKKTLTYNPFDGSYSNCYHNVYFADGEDISSLKLWYGVEFSCLDVEYKTGSVIYHDAKLMKAIFDW